MLPGVGVFGTDSTVKCLVPILLSCGFKVNAIWGLTRDDAAKTALTLKIDFHTDKVDEVLLHKDVDLVFIHCPPQKQSPIAVKALGIGKHVICGTPGGPRQLEALHMVKAAQYYPSLMSVMCNGLRFLPCFVEMRKRILEGYIGEVTACEARVLCGTLLEDNYNWKCEELMGGGVLNIYGGIIIDLITFLTSQRATSVHAMLKTFTTQTENIDGIRRITSDDFCSLQMELEQGACVALTLNNYVPSQFTHDILICGTKGYLVVRNTNLFGQTHHSDGEERLFTDDDDTLNERLAEVTENFTLPIKLKVFLKLPCLSADSTKIIFIYLTKIQYILFCNSFNMNLYSVSGFRSYKFRPIRYSSNSFARFGKIS